MRDTKISWTDDTWNPTDGCEVCSPGCKNCYAMKMAGRFSGPGKPYHGLVQLTKRGYVWNGEGRLNRKALCKPLRWRKGRRVFVNSMSDLFFEKLTDAEIEEVFTVMALAPRHTFQVLTKRGERMRDWYLRPRDGNGNDALQRIQSRAWEWLGRASSGVPRMYTHGDIMRRPWPLPNVWQGVSVDDRKHGLPRIQHLRDTPAAVRFLSIEPLLEDLGALDLRGIHWVIAGCESGPGARACEVDWLRSIRDQCAAQRVPLFLKQAVARAGECTLTNIRPIPQVEGRLGEIIPIIAVGDGSHEKGRGNGGPIVELPYLDGVQHANFPEAQAA